MLKANELRIGNYINMNVPISEDGKLIRASVYHIGKLQKMKDAYHHVTLTEKWLLKFGFEEIKPLENDEHKWSTYSKNGVHIDLPYFEFNIEEISQEIKYVHQLQNLYFALTGVELQLSSNEG